MKVSFDYLFSLDEIKSLLVNIDQMKRYEYFCYHCKNQIIGAGFKIELFDESAMLCDSCGRELLKVVTSETRLTVINTTKYYNSLKPLSISIIDTWGYQSGQYLKEPTP